MLNYQTELRCTPMKKGIKKTIIIVFFMIFAIAISSNTVGKAEADGEEYAIVVSANASPTEMYAAQTLQEYLNLLHHSNFEIITDE